jgi:hypothetical protein
VGSTYKNSSLEPSPFELDAAEAASTAARGSIGFTSIVVDDVNVAV